mgnify:CR=1 FL=1
MSYIKKLLEEDRDKIWPIPLLMTILAVLIALLTTQIDQIYADVISNLAPWLFTGTADAARSLLSTIATAIATIASIVFSISIIAIQQATTQYSSRAIRSFIQNRGNQITIGAYLATFLFALIVLRAVRSEEALNNSGSFVPVISVTLALVLAFICVGLLIYLINQVVSSIQASRITRDIHHGLSKQIDNLFPRRIGHDYQKPEEPDKIIAALGDDQDKVSLLRSHAAGFVRHVDEEDLSKLSRTMRALYVLVPIGHFVHRGEVIARAYDLDPRRQEETEKLLNDAIQIGTQRSVSQDPLFALQQLIDLALKTYSGEPTTAEYCLNYIGDGLANLVTQEFPSNRRQFQNDPTLYLFTRPTWEDFLDLAFDQPIRTFSSNYHLACVIARTIQRVAENAPIKQRLSPLRRKLDRLEQAVKQKQYSTEDDKSLMGAITGVRQNLR